ncbi:P-type ATPase (P-ATPase) Superfamily [Achlya hypogyna]|uniref:P-type ATPase (P-ATPase) Superfamily n=1 Tax=Achlya hypogyna TaxID=1202772 RepID=A0A1V9YCS2_ACHHY|nr:P-type ATPase (P-ATPase) Superfamily [Achlya hypogyna]
MAGWNFFLALPIISIGVFDEDVPAAQVTAYPPLYVTGQRNEDLNVKCFCLWILNAMLHACISFWVPLRIVPAYFTQSFYLQGTTIYSGLLMTMNAKVILETLTWTWFSYSVITFSFLLFFFFLGVYPFCTFLGTDMVGITPQLLSASLYWDVFFLIPVACILVDVTIKLYAPQRTSRGTHTFACSISRYYYPTHADILRERVMLQRIQAKVSCGTLEQGLPPKPSYAHSIVERTPVERAADEKAGMRNVGEMKYTGFAYSAPDEEDPNRCGTAREIATLRVEHYKRMSVSEADGRTASNAAFRSTGSHNSTKRFLEDQNDELS